MQGRVQIAFHGEPVSEAVAAACEREVAKLERYGGRITGCRVTIVRSQHRRAHGDRHEVHLLVSLPSSRVAVTRVAPEHRTNERLDLALREAFDTARRELQDVVRHRRHDVKAHSRAAKSVRAPRAVRTRGAAPAGR